MSVNTYKATGLPNSGVVEQTGERVWSLGQGIGRTDSLDTTFVCRTADANALVATKFAPYAPHPTLSGMLCLPQSARWAEKWSGLSIISASFMGSRAFPTLPDAYFLATGAGEQIFPGLEASSDTSPQYGSALIPEARMVFQIYYIEHVHYSVDIPEVQENVGNIYLLKSKFLNNSSAALVLDYSEILESQGNYHHIRDRYVPILAAVNQRVYSASTDRVSSGGKLQGIDFSKMGGTLLTSDITVAEFAMFISSSENKRIPYVGEATDLRLTKCSISDSIYLRQSR